MTHIEKAIREAVEKEGYRSDFTPSILMPIEDFVAHLAKVNAAVLDPAFWQALGKARGWKNDPRDVLRERMGGGIVAPPWISIWHRFIDHLAEGKDAESFFATL